MRQCIVIKPEWLTELAPHYYKQQDVSDASTVKMPKGQGKAGLDADSSTGGGGGKNHDDLAETQRALQKMAKMDAEDDAAANGRGRKRR